MKKNFAESAKILKVIENDRLSAFSDSVSIIENDIFKVLKEYFSLSAPPEIEITKNGDKYAVFISAVCDGLKSFGKI